MLTSYFHLSKLCVLPLKTDTDKCLRVSKSYKAENASGQWTENWILIE